MYFFYFVWKVSVIMNLGDKMKEDIIAVLEKSGIALDLLAISDELGLKTVEELRSLDGEINALVKDFVVYKTKKDKYMLYSKCANFKMGKLSVNKKGFGFLIVNGGEDIYISKDNIGYALDKDEVLVEIIAQEGKKIEGKVLKVLKRDLSNIVGIIKSDGKDIYFEPKEEIQIGLEITKESLSSCVEGEIVVVKTIEELGKNRYSAEVVKHICHKDDANEDILTIAAQYEIYPDFPEDAMKEAEGLPNEVLDEDRIGRRDLTDRQIVTIDDITTKDIDDAISIEKCGDMYVLGVHIADVSYYVKENSPLDKEAFVRGTSSYLADAVIPQLPHKLSNGICSLNPNVDRCAITCEMKIDSRGMIVDSDIYPSVINSKKKMTYTSVNHYLMSGIVDEGYEEFTEMMTNMQELAHIIRAERIRRGASDFGTDEPKIVCDENGRAIDIKKREQLEGEKLIEDFMVAANETVARTISMLGIPSIYRVHDVPKEEKIAAYITFCVSAGKIIKGKYKTMNPHMFQKLLDQVATGDETDAIFRSMAVRCMPKAKYDTNNIGHFGLASMYYTHFTSPIRRYPDLQVHRILRTCLFEHNMDNGTFNYLEQHLPGVAEHSSEREVAATEAERAVTKKKMSEYMENHINEEYSAIISGVMKSGFFVQLDNLVEGFVNLDTLPNDIYTFVEEHQCIIAKNSKKKYTFGDRVRVRCISVNVELSYIDFALVLGDKNDRN